MTPTRGFADARFEDFALSALALGAGRRRRPRRAGWADGLPGGGGHRARGARPTPTSAWRSCSRRSRRRRGRAGARGSGAARSGAARAERGRRALGLPGDPARPGRAGWDGATSRTSRGRPRSRCARRWGWRPDRDTVAAEYVRGFAVTFDLALARLCGGRWPPGLALLDAIAQAHLELMAPGAGHADRAQGRRRGGRGGRRARARAVVRAGGLGTPTGARPRRGGSTGELRRDGNRLNPGTIGGPRRRRAVRLAARGAREAAA